ncbi:hypothetical protein BpHYR1_051558 [Brachionus plicatilis]|uniref:Uncharacterized protein n=1 Tax=Brachionus plicatilis TaxID=10195 RepID=A0A3M7RLZ3_BRAPC|nr:hypothetical protein BpHYR1_051558 [Brachionus plicatilis]
MFLNIWFSKNDANILIKDFKGINPFYLCYISTASDKNNRKKNTNGFLSNFCLIQCVSHLNTGKIESKFSLFLHVTFGHHAFLFHWVLEFRSVDPFNSPADSRNSFEIATEIKSQDDNNSIIKISSSFCYMCNHLSKKVICIEREMDIASKKHNLESPSYKN